MLENPTVRFTGHRSLRIRPGVPTGTSGHIEAELEKTLADFGGEDFTALVLEQAASRLGWAQAEDGAGADAVMQIRVENICFCAPDGLSEVEAKLALRVVLTENGSGDVLWRDCLDWSFEGLYSSLQDLAQTDAAQQKELLSELAERLLDRLAKHLASQLSRG